MAKRKTKTPEPIPVSLTLPIADMMEAMKHLGASVDKGAYLHYTQMLLVDFDGEVINMVTTDGQALTVYRVGDCETAMVGQVLIEYHRLLDYCKLFTRLHGKDKSATVTVTATGVDLEVAGMTCMHVAPDEHNLVFPPYKRVLKKVSGAPAFMFGGRLMADNIRNLQQVALYSDGPTEPITVVDDKNQKLRRVLMPLSMD